VGRLRADARRNRERVLLAARDVFVERGADAPLEDVAHRAGVGIATLYRRFPDRQALLRAVAVDLLTRTADLLRTLEAEEPDPFRAIARYMHAALDLRISALMPALLGHISFEDDAFARARDATTEPLLRLIQAAQATGRLRSDVTFADIGLLLVRLSQPLPGAIPRELDLRLAHRHLDLVLTALENDAGQSTRTPLRAPALTLQELQNLGAVD
jgi:AcrR family transcriptional regulator